MKGSVANGRWRFMARAMGQSRGFGLSALNGRICWRFLGWFGPSRVGKTRVLRTIAGLVANPRSACDGCKGKGWLGLGPQVLAMPAHRPPCRRLCFRITPCFPQ